jgi:hypothetical protein
MKEIIINPKWQIMHLIEESYLNIRFSKKFIDISQAHHKIKKNV